MYKISKNYEKLYQHVIDNNKPICFINGSDGLCKHICWVDRTKYGIEFTRDGGDFGCVSEQYIKKCGSEKQAFINLCLLYDCDWIQP